MEPDSQAGHDSQIGYESEIGYDSQIGHDQGEETGEARVDRVVAGLGRLAGLPVDEHVAVFEDAHSRLSQVLSELDSGPAAEPHGR
jgi:hypothetical protein